MVQTDGVGTGQVSSSSSAQVQSESGRVQSLQWALPDDLITCSGNSGISKAVSSAGRLGVDDVVGEGLLDADVDVDVPVIHTSTILVAVAVSVTHETKLTSSTRVAVLPLVMLLLSSTAGTAYAALMSKMLSARPTNALRAILEN